MIKEPVFFERNRVGRVYSGGKLFNGFFGDEPVDGFLPEEWIASAVAALNKDKKSEKEGVSKVKDSDMYFDELLEKYPLEMLGKSQKMRILVKVLDSAVRLPAQAHPDKAFSRKHFNSEYGKTESWIVLDTRPEAKIYFGFKDKVTRDSFMQAIDESKTDKDAMEKLMEYTEPKVGDVFIVPAKTVHAIGAGCLILEIQEPTDFTIQPEHWCDNYELSDEEMYIGLSKEDAVDCFDFVKSPDTKLTPKMLFEENGVKVENLINENDTDCFIINKITLENGKYTLDVKDSYSVYIVTDGKGKIMGDNYEKPIAKGDYFFMPYSLMGKFAVEGSIEVVECF
ncbi:MAG: class I mannose-6-phosphate isomerase [Clostridia bacterium]|nr:class I mannose-6-phosphate isomerase [Clostridia bacterium]